MDDALSSNDTKKKLGELKRRLDMGDEEFLKYIDSLTLEFIKGELDQEKLELFFKLARDGNTEGIDSFLRDNINDFENRITKYFEDKFLEYVK
jgi:hypothetical protein